MKKILRQRECIEICWRPVKPWKERCYSAFYWWKNFCFFYQSSGIWGEMNSFSTFSTIERHATFPQTFFWDCIAVKWFSLDTCYDFLIFLVLRNINVVMATIVMRARGCGIKEEVLRHLLWTVTCSKKEFQQTKSDIFVWSFWYVLFIVSASILTGTNLSWEQIFVEHILAGSFGSFREITQNNLEKII